MVKPVFNILIAGVATLVQIPKCEVDGDWVVSSIERDGKLQAVVADKVILRNEMYASRWGMSFPECKQGHFSLNTNREPKSIDLMPTDGPNKNISLAGIYRIDGGSLILCFDISGKARPKTFTTEAGSGRVLIAYVRQP